MGTISTQYMGLGLPVVSSEPGPEFAQDINNALTTVDQHDHSRGKGTQVTPAGLNINADLSLGDNNATDLRSTRYASSGVPLSSSSDIGCVYVSGVDLYYNDVNGNQVRLTQNGQTYPAPTIPGMTGGAALFYSTSAQKFTFQSSTGSALPAGIDAGPVTVRSATSNAPGVTLSSAAGASSYSLNLPPFLPTSAGDFALVATSASQSNFVNSPVVTFTTLSTPGSGTYSPKAGCTWIKGRVQGGGGGGGCGAGGSNAGSAGSLSTIYGTSAFGGSGGTPGSGPTPVAGGGYAGGSYYVAIPGQNGQPSPGANLTINLYGGNGGNSFLGLGGIGGANGAGPGGAPVSGYGGGGGAGGGGGSAAQYGGCGGSAGGYAEFIILNPTSSSYYVATSGAGGINSTPSGGNGAQGVIILEEHYAPW